MAPIGGETRMHQGLCHGAAAQIPRADEQDALDHSPPWPFRRDVAGGKYSERAAGAGITALAGTESVVAGCAGVGAPPGNHGLVGGTKR